MTDATAIAGGVSGLSAGAKDAALLEIASEGDLEAARLLVEAGANVNVVAEVGGRVPLEAAAAAGDLPMMSLLLEHGAHPDGNAAKDREYCPLVRAFEFSLPPGFVPRGRCVQAPPAAPPSSERVKDDLALAMVKRLLEAGAAIDDRGATVLGLAAENASLAVFALLLERATKLSDLAEAVIRSIPSPSEPNAPKSEAVAKMKLVLDRHPGDLRGTDLRALTRGLGADGNVALFELAHVEGHEEEVAKLGEMLLDRGANAMTATRAGETVLHFAVQSRQTPLAGLLIERGANPLAATSVGVTALHLAVQSAQLDLAKLLIERGAEPDAKTSKRDVTFDAVKSGATPRKMAETLGGTMAALFAGIPTHAKRKAPTKATP